MFHAQYCQLSYSATSIFSGMEDVAVIFGQPQLLVVDLPYGDGEAEFAQQGIYCVLIAYIHY